MTIKRPTAWSFTALSTFETCPLQYKHKYVLKDVPFEETEAIKEGNRAHTALENFIAKGESLPSEFAHFAPIMAAITKHKCELRPEQEVAATRDWKPTAYSYRNKDAWVRGKADLLMVSGATAIAIDYKTGKVKEDSDQLRLMAALVFVNNPHINTILTAFIWLKHGKMTSQVIHRNHLSILQSEYGARMAEVERANEVGLYPPKKSGLCRGWCPVKSCQYWEKPK
jgi:RecB family exonuclease